MCAISTKDTSCFKDCPLSGDIGNNLHTTTFGVHHNSAQQKDIEIDKNYSKKTQKLVQNLFLKKYIEEYENRQSLKCRVSLGKSPRHFLIQQAKIDAGHADRTIDPGTALTHSKIAGCVTRDPQTRFQL